MKTFGEQGRGSIIDSGLLAEHFKRSSACSLRPTLWKWTGNIADFLWGHRKARWSQQDVQPIKSLMEKCHLVSDSSVGDKKKAYSFYSITGCLVHSGWKRAREEKLVIKSSFISLLRLFFFFCRCSISCTHTLDGLKDETLLLLMFRRHWSQHHFPLFLLLHCAPEKPHLKHSYSQKQWHSCTCSLFSVASFPEVLF